MTQYVAEWEDGIRVKWRALSWSEYRQFRTQLKFRPLGISLEIYKLVKLEGPELGSLPAGISAFIAESVLAENPFSGSYKDVIVYLDQSRREVQSSYMQSARALVSHIFHYSFEDMDTWDAETFFRRLAMAEFVAGRPLEPGNPEAEEKRHGKPKIIKKALTDTQKIALERARQRGRP